MFSHRILKASSRPCRISKRTLLLISKESLPSGEAEQQHRQCDDVSLCCTHRGSLPFTRQSNSISVRQRRGATGWVGGASSLGGIWLKVHCHCALQVGEGVVIATLRPRQTTIYAAWHWGGRIPLPVGSHALHGPHNIIPTTISVRVVHVEMNSTTAGYWNVNCSSKCKKSCF